MIQNFIDPYLKDSWGNLGFVQALPSGGWRVNLPYPFEGLRQTVFVDLPKEVELVLAIQGRRAQNNLAALPRIKNIIAVGSGKGGVGKSTTALNLALGLQLEGAKVGLLDADIYGPNQPQMLGVRARPDIIDQKIQPILQFGLPTMSMGYLVDEAQPMIWRGPMISTALSQMIQDTAWPDLDYLIIDLPPGTGDIPLSLAQKIPLVGVVIVTTPQIVSVLDARKALAMFKKLGLPILGLVENMSEYHCPHCGHEAHLFGERGGARMAEQFQIPLLAQLPLDPLLCEYSDAGRPMVLEAHPLAEQYRDLARKMAAQLSLQPRDYSSKFPVSVVHE